MSTLMKTTVTRDAISFRPETADDAEFLYQLYASTREEELNQTDWTDAMKDAFLRQQFQAQTTHYKTHYTAADYRVILEHGKPVGRLYLNHLSGDVRIMDIALIPEARRRGIGELLLNEILDDAAKRGDSVSIHVEINNPALNLYERLGFKQIDTYGVYHLLEWKPTSSAANE
ncbi:MAG TPA: GNAT family N-acetyltransferase [Thermoanaerobaculia bacterium]